MRWLQNYFCCNLLFFGQARKTERNDLSRNSITVKIISRQFDEAWPKNDKLQQK